MQAEKRGSIGLPVSALLEMGLSRLTTKADSIDLELAVVALPQAHLPCLCEAAVVSAALTVVLSQLRLVVRAEAAVELALPLRICTGLKHTQVD
jgi:hypothetical protein